MIKLTYEECQKVRKVAIPLLQIGDEVKVRYQDIRLNGEFNEYDAKIVDIESDYIIVIELRGTIKTRCPKKNIEYFPEYGYYVYI